MTQDYVCLSVCGCLFPLSRHVFHLHQTCDKAYTLLETSLSIRRFKKEVEKSLLPKQYCKLMVPMTTIQQKCYRSILSGDSLTAEEHNNNSSSGSSNKSATDISSHNPADGALSCQQLSLVATQLQQVLNHPRIFLRQTTAALARAKVEGDRQDTSSPGTVTGETGMWCEDDSAISPCL